MLNNSPLNNKQFVIQRCKSVTILESWYLFHQTLKYILTISRGMRETPKLSEIPKIIENTEIFGNYKNLKDSIDASQFLLWI